MSQTKPDNIALARAVMGTLELKDLPKTGGADSRADSHAQSSASTVEPKVRGLFGGADDCLGELKDVFLSLDNDDDNDNNVAGGYDDVDEITVVVDSDIDSDDDNDDNTNNDDNDEIIVVVGNGIDSDNDDDYSDDYEDVAHLMQLHEDDYANARYISDKAI